ncbi:acyl-CoA dehydrogenase family protein [Caldimonas thermodepolymerans]|jgi:alkylation response protein AidB-like acyl-CoA dehydrogenase|uniref:acyl-CoA dehydrogenase family protein n=1 Tax=Caldimonas thermodepolymerans TaxID=215580 RepID=UPI002235B811|nr:acyl-CoA dehydrogenase family protein [Caldimonas thermodepolymerans]UZG46044.1 acyl-CoA dehydrogenase family protein [Caldimonas thermodepolymerans]
MDRPIGGFRHQRFPFETLNLRMQVRSFLAETLKDRSPLRRADSWMGADPAFSRELGRRGWVGMTLPKRYGGQDASPWERYVVAEELLAAGAPVAAHWFADRQSGPLILRYGTETQRERYLPGICRGEIYFCIGMSEPNSGSDLASIRSRAVRDGDGWVLNGQKVWTTNAHIAHYMIGLFRTGDGANYQAHPRHAGLSQFLIDLKSPGVTIRPIVDLTGGRHFNEVYFDNVRLGPDALLGTEGKGWEQVTAELAFERSGPERFLSSIALLHTLIDAVGRRPDALQAREIGRLVARLNGLRQMSLAVTAELAAGKDPAWEASCVKDLGAVFEQELPEIAQAIFDEAPAIGGGSDHAQVLAALMQMAPSFSLRGGTREILRGIIARGLGLR